MIPLQVENSSAIGKLQVCLVMHIGTGSGLYRIGNSRLLHIAVRRSSLLLISPVDYQLVIRDILGCICSKISFSGILTKIIGRIIQISFQEGRSIFD